MQTHSAWKSSDDGDVLHHEMEPLVLGSGIDNADQVYECEAERHEEQRLCARKRLVSIAALLVTISALLTILLYREHSNQPKSTRFMMLDRPSHLKVAMIMNTPNKEFCRSLYSLMVNQYPPPHLLHFNKSFTHGWTDKIESFANFVNTSVDANDVALLLDGFDVWAQLPAPTFMTRFGTFESQVVLGTDKKCWPNDPKSRICTDVKESPLSKMAYGVETDATLETTRPRWVCAGTQAGSGLGLKKVYQELTRRLETTPSNKVDDQRMLNEMIADKEDIYSGIMKVDLRSQLFQTMTLSHADMIWEVNPHPSTPPRWYSYDDQEMLHLNMTDFHFQEDQDRIKSVWNGRRLGRNMITNSIPIFLHFNGDKHFLDWWWPLMWYSDQEYREAILSDFVKTTEKGSFGAWVGNDWHSWTSLCSRERIF